MSDVPAIAPEEWRHHRTTRLVAAAAAAPAALFVDTSERALLVGGVGVYLVAAIVIASRSKPPAAPGPVWGLALAADCLVLTAALASLPEWEDIVLLGFLLVVVVNAVSFGVVAAVAAAATTSVGVVTGHVVTPDVRLATVALDVTGFLIVVVLVTVLVGRQTQDLRRHRAKLEVTLTELRRVDELRSRLVSTLAHDVRGPLGAIQMSVGTILAHGNGIAPETRTELLQGTSRQAERLLRLANGLLDLARLEEGKLELDIRTVRLRDLVAHALSFADTQGVIELAVDDDLCVAADGERLEQVVVNLLANSLRHGEPPFRVDAARRDGWVELAVRDQGRGVPPDMVDGLFQPFRRGDTAGSVGFGLWIVRMLAEAQGGSVGYEPNSPRGACFLVRLPGASCREADDPGP